MNIAKEIKIEINFNWSTLVIEKVKREIQKVIIGQEELIDSMLIALFSQGHILLEGLPGVAKTTAVNTLAKTLGFNFKRVQFTPDLLPSDIIGSEVLNLKDNDFSIKKGPIFSNILLADEINRAGAKVQSALLEAMAEGQVTIGEESLTLPEPFMVLATSNPIEQEGTYELPEASLDRFMMKVKVTYNSFEEELEIMERSANNSFEEVNQILDFDSFKKLKEELKEIHIDEEIKRYILEIITATREPSLYNLDHLKDFIDFGASPRASIDMYKASRANAWLRGRDFVTPADVASVAYLVLRHRIGLNYSAISVSLNSDEVIQTILETIVAP